MRRDLDETGTRIACAWVLLAFAALASAADPAIHDGRDEAADAADRRIYRLPMSEFDRLSEADRAALLPYFDPCAMDRDAGGEAHSVYFLSAEDVLRLRAVGRRLQDAGSITDHIARFAPRNTLQKKLIPSIEPLFSEKFAQGRAAATCEEIGTSLAPYNEYHNYAESTCFLQNLAAAYPHLARVVSIGDSLQGRDIWALRLTRAQEAPDDQKPRILFTGVMHAREWVTHEVVLYFAEQLVSRYGIDPAITKILDKTVVWLVPVVNPDGFDYTWTNERLWRKNRRDNLNSGCDGVDINRNFPRAWAFDESGSTSGTCGETYRGQAPASEPETQALAELLRKERFSIVVSFHSYSQLAMHPWGHTTQVTPQAFTAMRALARKYSSLVRDTSGAAYIPGQISYTIYLSNGDFLDSAYGDHGALSLIVELRPTSTSQGGFLLPENQILPTCEENLAAATWLMRNLADAMPTHHPYSPTLLEAPMPGSACRFSPSLPTLNQQITRSLGFPSQFIGLLTTRLDDGQHFPGVWGQYDADFEACGSGRGYQYQITLDPQTLAWPASLRNAQVMPYVFEDGAEVMLSNIEQGLNLIGVPGAHPVRLRDVRIQKRRLTRSLAGDFGFYEQIVEQRSALQDAASAAPWIDWRWRYVDSLGRTRVSHPSGAGRADTLVLPFRAYEVDVKVPSWEFGATSPLASPVYMLSFPGSSADCDGNGLLDMDDVLAGRAADCNGNLAPDACESMQGDANLFLQAVLSSPQDYFDVCMFDLDGDGHVDGRDIQGFVDRLLAP